MRLLVALIAVMICTASNAADLSRADRPVTWTGYYIGAHGGWLSGDVGGDLGYDDPPPPPPVIGEPPRPQQVPVTAKDIFADTHRAFAAEGMTAGGQFGINIQSGAWVYGAEFDAAWTDIKGSFTATTIGGDPTWNVDASLKWLATIRGRLGFVPFDGVMIYGTGGLAIGEVEAHNSVTYANPAPTVEIARGDGASTHLGWTAGAGVEVMLGRNWSVRAEYLYVDLGESDMTFSGTSDLGNGEYQTDSWSPGLQFHLMRGAVNYRF